MNRREFMNTAGGIVLAGVTSRSFADVSGINDAINKSGRQRMLSQRLAKAYLQLGFSVDSERSKKILDASVALFERQLSELRAFAPSAENKETLAALENKWIPYKSLLTGKIPNIDDAKSVISFSEEILTISHNATLQLEKISDTGAGKLVNTSGRQRMLSQRMAKYYQATHWGVAAPGDTQKLAAAKQEFVTALSVLSESPKNTIEIKREFELAQQQWMFFENALNNPKGGLSKQQLSINVATSSERILEVMDRITGMYQSVA